MTIGVCLVRLRIPESHSLKDKRQVLKAMASRIRNRFNVSVAEVDDHDRWQSAALGVSCVSNSSQHANEVLSRVIDYIEGSHFDVEVLGYEVELVHAL